MPLREVGITMDQLPYSHYIQVDVVIVRNVIGQVSNSPTFPDDAISLADFGTKPGNKKK